MILVLINHLCTVITDTAFPEILGLSPLCFQRNGIYFLDIIVLILCLVTLYPSDLQNGIPFLILSFHAAYIAIRSPTSAGMTISYLQQIPGLSGSNLQG